MRKPTLASVANLTDPIKLGEIASMQCKNLDDKELKHTALVSIYCPVDVLRAVALQADPMDCEMVFINPKCPTDLLDATLDKMRRNPMARAAADNPNATPAKALRWKMKFPKEHDIRTGLNSLRPVKGKAVIHMGSWKDTPDKHAPSFDEFVGKN